MEFIKIRPKRRTKREKATVALYTVAFTPSELRKNDDSFAYYCNNCCKYGIKGCRAQCNEGGEYGRLMHIWEEMGYLASFFQKHLAFFKAEYGLSVNDAILHQLLFVSVARKAIETGDIKKLFVPFQDEKYLSVQSSEEKVVAFFSKPSSRNWLRIYAVRFQDEDGKENYIITGGAIKTLRDSIGISSISEEEAKMDLVIRYLENNIITDREQIERVVLQTRL